MNPNIKVGYVFSKMPSDVDVFSADVDLLSVKNKVVTPDFVEKLINQARKFMFGEKLMIKEMIRLRNLR